jgi:hypothetical protein
LGDETNFFKDYRVLKVVDTSKSEKRYEIAPPEPSNGCIVFIERKTRDVSKL